MNAELPVIDVHSTSVAATPEVVFDALERIGPRLGTDRISRAYAGLVGTEDAGAFHVARSERPQLVVLAGSHRFSRYELPFRIEPTGQGSTMHAETRAVFPGVGGRLYRAAVIGSGGHRVAMRLLLSSLKRTIEPR
jgi:hypothetical protein